MAEITIDRLSTREKLALVAISGIVGGGQRVAVNLLGGCMPPELKTEMGSDGDGNFRLTRQALRGVIADVRRRIG